MKIAIITNVYQPYERGGAEKVVKNLVNELRKDNQVVLITTKPKGLAVGLEESQNLKKYSFFPLNIYYYLNDFKHNAIIRLIWHFFDQFNLHSYFVARNILKKENPDLVITHNLMGIGFLIPKALKKYKWIHTLHDVQLAVPSGLIIKGHEKDFLTNGFLTKCYAKINKWLFGSPQKIVSPSQWLLNFYNRKVFFKDSEKQVLPNPVLTANKQEPKYELSMPLKLLFIGQIQEHKGIIFLVDTLKKSDLKFNLTIVGAGTKEIELKSLIHDDQRFKYLGKVDSNQIVDLLSQTDYLIVPSLCYENSPTVIYEAFSQAVPAIGSNIGGIGELIKENQTGYLFEPVNTNSLIDAIKKANRPHNYNQMSQSCIDLIKEYSTNNYVKKLLD